MKKVGVITAPLAAALASSASIRVFARITARSSGGPQSAARQGRARRFEIVLGQRFRARPQLDVQALPKLALAGARAHNSSRCFDTMTRWGQARAAQLKRQFENASLYIRDLED
jgi:hypothetical protein